MLIDHGCDINKKDKLGHTALLKAQLWSHSSTAKSLLEHGTNSQERDNAWRPAMERVAIARETKQHKQESLQRDKVK